MNITAILLTPLAFGSRCCQGNPTTTHDRVYLWGKLLTVNQGNNQIKSNSTVTYEVKCLYCELKASSTAIA